MLSCALRGRDCLFCEPQNSLGCSVKQLQLPFIGAGSVWSRQWAVSPCSDRGQRGDCPAGPRAGSPVGDFPCSQPRWWGDWDQECFLLNEKSPFWFNSQVHPVQHRAKGHCWESCLSSLLFGEVLFCSLAVQCLPSPLLTSAPNLFGENKSIAPEG